MSFRGFFQRKAMTSLGAGIVKQNIFSLLMAMGDCFGRDIIALPSCIGQTYSGAPLENN